MPVSRAPEEQGWSDALQRGEMASNNPPAPKGALEKRLIHQENIRSIARPLRQLANSPRRVARQPARSLTD